MVEKKSYSSKHELSIKIYLTVILTIGCCGKCSGSIGTKLYCLYSTDYGIMYTVILYLCTDMRITLSPMSVAPVCHVGDPLQLTCITSVDFLEWHMRVISEQGRLEEITAFSNLRDMTQQPTLVVVNDTSFTFMRISARNATPLVSTLSINSTSIGLNGTVVHCMDPNNLMTSASTTIHIIGIINSKCMHELQLQSL